MLEETASWKRRLEADDDSPPTLLDVLLSAFGYFLVAILCSLAGYALAHKTTIPVTFSEWVPLIILWALLAPAYVGRAVLYECTKTKFITRDDRKAIKWQKTMSWQYGLAAFLFGIAVAGPLLTRLGRDNPALVAQIVCTIAPMYILGLYLGVRWPSDLKLFDFRYRNFFPALATCLPPFVFGYETGGDLFCSLAATSLVILPWLVALVTPARRFAIGGFVVLVVSILALPLQSALTTSAVTRCIVLCTFGLLLTLAMGVCETWRFIARVLNDIEYRPDGQFSAETKQYYLGGANLATALFLPIFLWTALHPATTRVYVIAAFMLLAFQYAAWYRDHTETKQTWWPHVGAVIGYLYPVVVTIGTSLSEWPVSDKISTSPSLFDMLTAWGALAVPAIPLVRYSGLWHLFNEQERIVKFRSFALCAGTTGLTALVLACSAVGSMFVLGQLMDSPPAAALRKATFLVFVYVVIALVCTAAVLIGRFYRPHRVSAQSPKDATPSGGPSLHYVVLTLASGRPLPAFIASTIPIIACWTNGGGLAKSLAAGGALFFATLFGFVVNDIFDYAKDRAAQRPRPIAADRLPRDVAWRGAAFLAAGAVVCGVAVNGGGAILMVLMALFVYTPFARMFPLLKGLYTAGLCVMPVLFAAAVLSGSVNAALVGALAMFVIGRELLLDLQDLATDERWGLRTLAAFMGERRALIIGVALMSVGAVMVMLLTFTPLAKASAACATASVAIIFCLGRVSLDRQLQLSRITMMCGAIAVALSVAV